MKLEGRDSFGVVTACYEGDYHFVKATCASIKHFCPDIPICVIVDGDFNVDELIDIYHPYILRTNEVEDREMRKLCSGNNRSKLLAMWLGPFDRFIYLDADAIFWGDVVSKLDWSKDKDFIIFWEKSTAIAHRSWLSNFYFDIDTLQLYDPSFDWELNPYFCSGAFAARKNAISFDDWMRCESWRKENPQLFSWTKDQGIMNYLVFSLSQSSQLTLGIQDLQWIPIHKGIEETVKELGIRGYMLPSDVEKPHVLHFCGKKPYVYDYRSYSRPFTLCRLQHYRYVFPGMPIIQRKKILEVEFNSITGKIRSKLSMS